MRFLFLSSGYPNLSSTHSGSGIGTYVREMATGLTERGHECHVLTWSNSRDEGTSAIDGIHVHFIRRNYWPVVERFFPDSRNVAIRQYAAQRLSRACGFDWIEIQSDEGIDIGVQQRFPSNTIVRVHTTLKQMVNAKEVLPTRRGAAYLARERHSFHIANKVVTHCHKHADALRACHPELSAPIIVPHGVGKAAAAPTRARQNDVPKILVVGTLDLRKGTDRLGKILRAYAQRFGSVELRLVTSSPVELQRTFELDASRLPGVIVNVLRNLTHAELTKEYQSSTMLLHLARYESFGLPLIEAAANALPIVATRSGIAEELLGGLLQPYLIDGDDTDQVTASMHHAVAERESIGSELYRRYCQQFTRDAMVDTYLEKLRQWT